jgi:hypothetical protein
MGTLSEQIRRARFGKQSDEPLFDAKGIGIVSNSDDFSRHFVLRYTKTSDGFCAPMIWISISLDFRDNCASHRSSTEWNIDVCAKLMPLRLDWFPSTRQEILLPFVPLTSL